jgi:tetratricopeptide (TPR) repeat protein
MKHVLFACFLASAALASATALCQVPTGEVPQTTPTPTDASGGAAETPKGPIDLKAVLTPEQYLRAIQPILASLQQAEKALALYDEEMGKPEKDRDESRALGFKERAARFYAAAALRARQSKGYVAQEAYKAAITDQYEIPARDKAIAIYMELAQLYTSKGDLRAAVAYYQRILNLNPGNADATDALKRIADTLKQQAADRAGNPSQSGGGGANKNNPSTTYQPGNWQYDLNRHSADWYKNRYTGPWYNLP